ncbi:MAG TPA: PQQ-binding-like beta-propeller repeat protein [Planctomycetota bacterium]|jgi:outer membrane protein assembly factor BamB
MKQFPGRRIALIVFFGLTLPALSGEVKKQPLGSREFSPSPQRPVGWRGDGNGRYPAAEPPLTWGRQAKAINGLRTQAKKPGDADTGKSMSDGIVRQWLVLGPVSIPEGKTAKAEFSPEEGNVSPDEGEKSGNLAWTALTTDTSWVNFAPLYLKGEKPEGLVAYAHTWLYVPEPASVFMNFMAADATLVWLNGKPVKPRGHAKLDLLKGWNRLLLRVAPHLETDWSRGVIQWHFNAAFFGADPTGYETSNILWSTVLPDNGPGAGSPIVVGDKVFVQAESCELICLNANDGKVLWARATTSADAATADDKAKNAAVFAEIAPLQTLINAQLQAYVAGPQKYPLNAKALEERLKAERKINSLMERMDPQRFVGQSESEGGHSAATPVSDGQHVYVLYGFGLAACYDLDGNLKWATALGLKHQEHGYCGSPCLIDGKLIIKSSGYLGAVALDAKTGAVAMPIPLWKQKGLHSMSTPVVVPPASVPVVGPASAPAEKLIVQSFGVLTRASDGKIVAQAFTPPYYNIEDYSSPVVEGRTICSFVLPKGEDGARRWAFQTLPETLASLPAGTEAGATPLTMQDTKTCQYNTKAFPTWFSYNLCGSPLLHQGLAYVVSSDAVLTVMDAAKGELVYQKVLDLSPYIVHGGIIRGGCSCSPTLGGQHIYICDNQGTAVVLEPGREFKQVARNRLEQMWFRYGEWSRQECTVSSPVFVGKRMYYRGEVSLYCVEGK